jgi:hypothetical protein
MADESCAGCEMSLRGWLEVEGDIDDFIFYDELFLPSER